MTDSNKTPGREVARARIVLRLALLFLSLGVTAVLLEVGMRVWLGHMSDPDSFRLYASMRQLNDERILARKALPSRRHIPHRYLGYVPLPGFDDKVNRHNSLGFRGEEITPKKPAGEFRIACLGGSTTYETGVADYRESYPHLLEKELHRRGYPEVRVINAGVEGYSSWETLINLSFRVVDLEPDLILGYDGINDIHARFVWPPEAYRGDNSGRRISPVSSVMMPSILEYSSVLRFLLIRSGMATPHSDLASQFDPAPKTWQAPRMWRQQWRKSRRPASDHGQVSGETMLDNNPPIYFARNLRSIVGAAKSHGAEVVLITYASTNKHKDPTGRSSEYVRAIGEMNETVRSVAAETAVHLFDFRSAFPNDRTLYADGQHVNPAGSALKAQVFADYLQEQGLLPEKCAAGI